jgi:hypothetical protein
MNLSSVQGIDWPATRNVPGLHPVPVPAREAVLRLPVRAGHCDRGAFVVVDCPTVCKFLAADRLAFASRANFLRVGIRLVSARHRDCDGNRYRCGDGQKARPAHCPLLVECATRGRDCRRVLRIQADTCMATGRTKGATNDAPWRWGVTVASMSVHHRDGSSARPTATRTSPVTTATIHAPHATESPNVVATSAIPMHASSSSGVRPFTCLHLRTSRPSPRLSCGCPRGCLLPMRSRAQSPATNGARPGPSGHARRSARRRSNGAYVPLPARPRCARARHRGPRGDGRAAHRFRQTSVWLSNLAGPAPSMPVDLEPPPPGPQHARDAVSAS